MCKSCSRLSISSPGPSSPFFTPGFTILLEEGDKELLDRVPRTRDSPGRDAELKSQIGGGGGQELSQHHGPAHGQHFVQSLSPRESQARARGGGSSEVSSCPRAAAESRSPPGCPLTHRGTGRWGAETPLWELPSLLDGMSESKNTIKRVEVTHRKDSHQHS